MKNKGVIKFLTVRNGGTNLLLMTMGHISILFGQLSLTASSRYQNVTKCFPAGRFLILLRVELYVQHATHKVGAE